MGVTSNSPLPPPGPRVSPSAAGPQIDRGSRRRRWRRRKSSELMMQWSRAQAATSLARPASAICVHISSSSATAPPAASAAGSCSHCHCCWPAAGAVANWWLACAAPFGQPAAPYAPRALCRWLAKSELGVSKASGARLQLAGRCCLCNLGTILASGQPETDRWFSSLARSGRRVLVCVHDGNVREFATD